jgi:hypothetical protein
MANQRLLQKIMCSLNPSGLYWNLHFRKVTKMGMTTGTVLTMQKRSNFRLHLAKASTCLNRIVYRTIRSAIVFAFGCLSCPSCHCNLIFLLLVFKLILKAG